MKKFIFISLAFLLPAVVSAQGGTFVDSFMLIVGVQTLVGRLIIVVAAIALLVFFWGLVKYINKASEGEVKEGRDLMIWGTIALFVMVSIWGLVRFIQGELLPGEDFSNVNIPGFQ